MEIDVEDDLIPAMMCVFGKNATREVDCQKDSKIMQKSCLRIPRSMREE